MKALVVLTMLASLAACAAEGGWSNGPPTSPDYFPIAVWLQQARNAPRYKAAGINLYIGLWEGPTEPQFAELEKVDMPVICAQNAVGLAYKGRIIVGWMHGDEPDNAQPITDADGKTTGWGPCVPPPRIVADYERMKQADPTRPILLNLGQGVANDKWYGRGNGAKQEDYLTYVRGGDIVSFDVYPVAGIEKPDGENYLWMVAQGTQRLIQWSEGKRQIWNVIECTRIGSDKRATPAQVKAEVWMALIHGATGIVYFCHAWKPQFNEWALLDDPEMLPAVTAINQQVHDLAPVLNSPTVAGGVKVTSAPADVPVAALCKRLNGKTYVFAVGMKNGATHAKFQVAGLTGAAKAEVIGEGRTVAVTDGAFEDAFEAYAVHLYRLGAP